MSKVALLSPRGDGVGSPEEPTGPLSSTGAYDGVRQDARETEAPGAAPAVLFPEKGRHR